MSLWPERSQKDDTPWRQDQAKSFPPSQNDMKFSQSPTTPAIKMSSYSYSHSHSHSNGYIDSVQGGASSPSSAAAHLLGDGVSAAAGVRERIFDYLGEALVVGRDLPMYKDKPRYRRSPVQGSWSRLWPRNWKRRWAVGGAAVFVFLLWISGVFGTAWGSLNEQVVNWNARRNQVRQAFLLSWEDYARHAWGKDVYSPLSLESRMLVNPDHRGQLGTAGAGWIIVDALDTAIMMNLTQQVAQARDWIRTSLDFSQVDGSINTFETTIRVLGGLLGAHHLSSNYPHLAPQTDDGRGAQGEDLYIEKAVDLADRLLGAFETPTGVPLSSVNLNTSVGIPSHDVGGTASTAEATTLQLELKYLAKITGEPIYWEKAEKVMEAIDAPREKDGLLPIFFDPKRGTFAGSNIRLGSRGDSYYEYLVKQYLQTGERESVYAEMWQEALEGIKRHLITWSAHGNFTILGERGSGLDGQLSGKMDHLVCFMPGTIALSVTGGETVAAAKARLGKAWGRQQEEDMLLAEELMKTCWGMYVVTPTGLAPEIAYLKGATGPALRWQFDDPTWTQPISTVPFSTHASSHGPGVEGKDQRWRDDYDIRAGDVHNLQRPETIESLFYLWRITRDEKYRHWAWRMFRAFLDHGTVYTQNNQPRAFVSLDNVLDRTHETNPAPYGFPNGGRTRVGDKLINPANYRHDNMEGFWLAETLKYFYLIFSDDDDPALLGTVTKSAGDDAVRLPGQNDWNDLSKIVINTEAHFFPRFDIKDSKVWKTGWTRKTRGEMKSILDAKKSSSSSNAGAAAVGKEGEDETRPAIMMEKVGPGSGSNSGDDSPSSSDEARDEQ